MELESRCTELEQYSRKNTLKIEGISEFPDENTFNTVLDVCGNLKLDPPIQLDDIDNCHRVGREAADFQVKSQNMFISVDTSYMHTILNTEGKTKSVHWYTTSVMMYLMLL